MLQFDCHPRQGKAWRRKVKRNQVFAPRNPLCGMVLLMAREIRIAGGGLAGLTLGILLRREGVPVEIWDAGTYPRHRVCGEFISGRGVEILRQLAIPGLPLPLGSQAGTVRFFNSEGSSKALALPEAALAIDRATLDELLAREFQRHGGVLFENRRWTGSFDSEGVVRATGRRLRKGGVKGLLGLKVHARNVALEADLEVHFSDAGYVGLSRLKDGVVNICGLFRDNARIRNAGGRSATNFGQIFSSGMGEAFGTRLNSADYNQETFSAVTGISLKREKASRSNECRIGDSICMIPPMTGNGMSIAIESGAVAAPILRKYCRRESTWKKVVEEISRGCDQAFQKRLLSASILQKLCFHRGGRAALLSTLRTVPSVWGWGFRLTR